MTRQISNGVKIQLLYFSGCPSYKQGMENLKQALRELALPEDFEMINVDSNEKAVKYHFIGSPTIKISEEDLDPRVREAKVTGYRACRIYQTEEGIKGAPTVGMIKKAIRESQENE